MDVGQSHRSEERCLCALPASMSFKVSSPTSGASLPKSPNGRRASTRPEDNPYIKSLIEQRANELRLKAKEEGALQSVEVETKTKSKWTEVSKAVSVSAVFQSALTEKDENKKFDDEAKKEGQRFLGVRIDTLIRFFKVASAFPFIIVVASVNLSPKLSQIIRSDVVIRMMNVSMYFIPFILVRIVLSQLSPIVQKVTIALYLSMYLGPVTTVIFAKINLFTANTGMAEGTFCFKPARSVRMTQANFFALLGFAFEWIQHITYVLPIGIVTKNEQTLLVDYPPYLEFKYYFWIAIVASFGSGMILIINAVAKGQFLYRFRQSSLIWYFIYNVGSPMYMTIVTILFYALNCDERIDPPTLIQDSKMVCYSPDHVTMANASLIAIAMYIVQNTLLPTGTYKETMRENDLDIMFVPVYLQAHYLMKCILCYIYVFFYRDNDVRVTALTALNLLLLYLNNTMKPCSVEWINVLRDTVFIHASLSGIQSMNYLRYEPNTAMKMNLISSLACNVFFTSLCMYSFWSYSHRTPEYTIAKAFLDLEWQVARGGTVHPRVLEQLIALTISSDKVRMGAGAESSYISHYTSNLILPHEQDDWEIAKKYINQLVWLISYPNTRVQFQTTWALANLARKPIHSCSLTLAAANESVWLSSRYRCCYRFTSGGRGRAPEDPRLWGHKHAPRVVLRDGYGRAAGDPGSAGESHSVRLRGDRDGQGLQDHPFLHRPHPLDQALPFEVLVRCAVESYPHRRFQIHAKNAGRHPHASGRPPIWRAAEAPLRMPGAGQHGPKHGQGDRAGLRI